MSKDFIWILSLIFLTILCWVGLSLAKIKTAVYNEAGKEAIYAPLDATLDIEFLKQLESNR